MANTLATPHWAEIRRLAEQGVPLPKLAEEYGLAEKTVFNRSGSEDWLTPSRLKHKVEQLAKKSRENGSSPLLRGSGGPEKSDSLLLETWETRAASLRNLSYDVAIQAIKESKGQIVIESASDLKHAVHVARQATGLLDTDAPQIQLSMFANSDICGPSVMESKPIEAESVCSGGDDADFWG
jgi:hypothetical protein